MSEAENSKKVYERKIKVRGLETEMKKKQAEQDEKIKTLEETITIQSQVIEKMEEKSQSQDRKIAELEENFQSLSVHLSSCWCSQLSARRSLTSLNEITE